MYGKEASEVQDRSMEEGIRKCKPGVEEKTIGSVVKNEKREF